MQKSGLCNVGCGDMGFRIRDVGIWGLGYGMRGYEIRDTGCGDMGFGMHNAGRGDGEAWQDGVGSPCPAAVRLGSAMVQVALPLPAPLWPALPKLLN